MTTLSVAMIVKNEEHMLPGCLESIRELADELVVIDTGGEPNAPGSKDATRELVIGFSDHAPVTLKERPWQGDFSLHRNQSLDLADGDWVLVLDADERAALAPGLTPGEFKDMLERTPPDIQALAVQLEDIQEGRMVMTCNQARLFRRGAVRYQGRVHNQPIYGRPWGCCPTRCTSCTWDTTAGSATRRQSSCASTICSSSAGPKTPDDPETAFYFCQLYGNAGQVEKSIRWGERYLAQRGATGRQLQPHHPVHSGRRLPRPRVTRPGRWA
jgi:hypothetical protein